MLGTFKYTIVLVVVVVVVFSLCMYLGVCIFFVQFNIFDTCAAVAHNAFHFHFEIRCKYCL